MFDQTPEEHVASHHPDQAATQAERREMEQKLGERFAAAAAARNN